MTLLRYERPLSGKTVFMTGHTGFTGGWACLWLRAVGAKVVGYSLPPNANPNLFVEARIADDVESHFADILDLAALTGAMRRAKPDFVLHLAAQPLVRRSYREPLHTFAVNALGTANVLEAVRSLDGIRGVVCVTTDKVYKTGDGRAPRREGDELGGDDPYSASKAAAEMIISGYRQSFFRGSRRPVVSSARGGNIIGGGDWAEDRLIPDYVRAVTTNTPLAIRYPDAIRPWQHVLALVQGYLMLLARSVDSGADAVPGEDTWNFGPGTRRLHTVREVIGMLENNWSRADVVFSRDETGPECGFLALDSTRAREKLGWLPAWDTERSIAETAGWYRDYYARPETARQLSLDQINRWRGRGTIP